MADNDCLNCGFGEKCSRLGTPCRYAIGRVTRQELFGSGICRIRTEFTTAISHVLTESRRPIGFLRTVHQRDPSMQMMEVMKAPDRRFQASERPLEELVVAQAF